MSWGEELYLAMALFVFVAFGVLMSVMCWLDAEEDKIQRRREKAELTRHARDAARIRDVAVAGTAGAHS